MALGPVQLLVVGYGENAIFDGTVLDELDRLSEHDVVRLVDLPVDLGPGTSHLAPQRIAIAQKRFI